MIGTIINGSPLPLVLRDDYEPDRPASSYITVPVEDGGLDIILPGDPRYDRRNHRGPSQSEIAQANADSVRRMGSL